MFYFWRRIRARKAGGRRTRLLVLGDIVLSTQNTRQISWHVYYWRMIRGIVFDVACWVSGFVARKRVALPSAYFSTGRYCVVSSDFRSVRLIVIENTRWQPLVQAPASERSKRGSRGRNIWVFDARSDGTNRKRTRRNRKLVYVPTPGRHFMFLKRRRTVPMNGRETAASPH